jgi:ribosomal protein S16
MLLYSTRAEDFEAIKTLTNQGLSITEAVDKLLQPLSTQHYSTRAEDYEAIKALTNQGLSITEAVDKIVKQRARH